MTTAHHGPLVAPPSAADPGRLRITLSKVRRRHSRRFQRTGCRRRSFSRLRNSSSSRGTTRSSASTTAGGGWGTTASASRNSSSASQSSSLTGTPRRSHRRDPIRRIQVRHVRVLSGGVHDATSVCSPDVLCRGRRPGRGRTPLLHHSTAGGPGQGPPATRAGHTPRGPAHFKGNPKLRSEVQPAENPRNSAVSWAVQWGRTMPHPAQEPSCLSTPIPASSPRPAGTRHGPARSRQAHRPQPGHPPLAPVPGRRTRRGRRLPRLAQNRTGEERAILLALAEAEGRHEAHWLRLLGDHAAKARPASLRSQLLGFLARHFGSVFVLALAQRAEGRSPYATDPIATPPWPPTNRSTRKWSAAWQPGAATGSPAPSVPPFSAPTTAWSATSPWSWAWPRPAWPAAWCSSAAWQGCWPAPCPWPPANSSPCAPSASCSPPPGPPRSPLPPPRNWTSNTTNCCSSTWPAACPDEAAEHRVAERMGLLACDCDPSLSLRPELPEAEDQHEAVGTAWGAALSSFCFFASGAVVPILPFLFGMTGARRPGGCRRAGGHGAAGRPAASWACSPAPPR